jgi:hypothetical protein
MGTGCSITAVNNKDRGSVQNAMEQGVTHVMGHRADIFHRFLVISRTYIRQRSCGTFFSSPERPGKGPGKIVTDFRRDAVMADNEKITETPAVEGEEQFDIEVEELDSVSGGLSVSSLASAACPVSSFSSLSN